jgi:hypothetical protein
MDVRAFAIALSSCCLLCACGGGGGSTVTPAAGSTGVPPSATTSAPAASPTPVPSPYPRTAGDTFVYSGQLQQAYQTFPEVVAPGTPSPPPIVTTTVNVTQTVTVRTSQTFNGASGLTGLHSVETDALASGLKTTSATTDTYEALLTNAATSQLLDYGSQYADEAGDTISTLLAPAAVLDQLPETAGAQWANGPAATIDEAIAGDTTGSAVTVVRTVNSDGSYNEKTTYPPNYSAPGYTGVGNIQENADGSGTFSFVASGGTISITYSPPEPQPTGSPLITVKEYSTLDTSGNAMATFQIPAWFGTAAPLYAETDRNVGVVPVPASCNLAKTFPAQATAIAQTIARTDTILGYTETQTTTSYVAAGYGLLCATLSDTQTMYYDFNGDQRYVFTSQPPLQITTVAQTIALQPSSQIAGTTTSSSARAGTQAAQAPQVALAAALRANFDRSVRTAHRNRLQGLIVSATRLRAQGGIK